MRSLEAIGVLEKDDDKGGRRITQSGQRDLDRESTSEPLLDQIEGPRFIDPRYVPMGRR